MADTQTPNSVPSAWTTSAPEEVQQRAQPEIQGPPPMPQQQTPMLRAPSADELLVYALLYAAESVKLMKLVNDLTATIQGAAWCNSDGAERCDAWRRAASDGVMRSGAVAGFLVGRATE